MWNPLKVVQEKSPDKHFEWEYVNKEQVIIANLPTNLILCSIHIQLTWQKEVK